MSNDVSDPFASAETEISRGADPFPTDDVAASQQRSNVPYEVVVQGEEDAYVSLKDNAETRESEAKAARPTVSVVEIEPSQEIAMSLGDSDRKLAPESVEDEEKMEIEPSGDKEVEINAFEEMRLSPDVMRAIETSGYETPSPIQSETIPVILAGRDLMGQAETGSGKTAAFAWPLLSKIDLKLAEPQVLVLVPTRELAIQVTTQFEKYARGMKGFRAVTIYGGQSYETQLRALSRGVHVLVGTPGRLMDHLRRQTLDLRSLKTLVLDEADEMLRMGFIEDVEWILEQTPKQRQIVSFSATLPEPIQRIAKKYLHDPAQVVIESKSATAESIEQSCLFLQAQEKMDRLIRILETEETEGVLVFVKTRNSTLVVAENLIQKGIIASPLNGDIPQNQRERTVDQLKSGRINVVVATDVAARGLDVKRISHVINYDFPHDTEAYVHRIGRTGRAGRNGNAILFVEPKEKGKLSRLQRGTNLRIQPFQQKSIDQINRVRVEKFKQQIVDAMDDKQIQFFAKLVSDFQTETELPFADIAGALAVLAQGDSPLLLKELKKEKPNWRKGNDYRGNGRRRFKSSMTTYRVEVGRNHGVGPGNIVGAVANEANLNNADIGRINVFDGFSTIDLPAEIPQDVIDHLRNVQVMGQRLAISKSDRSYPKFGGRKSSQAQRGAKYGESKSDGSKKKFGDTKIASKFYGEKKFGDKRRGKRNGNASDQPSRLSEKRKNGPSEERSRFSGKAKKFKTPKTKAAVRTQAKRKSGAKPSSTMRKYVKIRSAKS